MKKITFLLAALLVIFSFGYAQKDFGGTLKIKTYAINTEDANILSQIQSESELTVWGSKTKIVNSQQGIGAVIIADGTTGITNIVLDLSQMAYGKYLLSDTNDNKFIQYDFEYDQTDTKTIAGFNCYKAIVTITNLENDESQSLKLYITEDLMNPATYKSFEYPGIKGYPMYTEMDIPNDGNPFTLVKEITEVKADKKVNAKSFILPAGWEPIENAPDAVKQMFGIGAGDEEDEEEY